MLSESGFSTDEVSGYKFTFIYVYEIPPSVQMVGSLNAGNALNIVRHEKIQVRKTLYIRFPEERPHQNAHVCVCNTLVGYIVLHTCLKSLEFGKEKKKNGSFVAFLG